MGGILRPRNAHAAGRGGRKVGSSGDGLAEALSNAGDAASEVPLIGDVLNKPLQSAADAGTGFADAGASLQETVTQVADVATTPLIVIPVLLILVLWLPPRACSGFAAA